MRKTTTAQTTLVAAGALTALSLALAPAAMAVTPSMSDAASTSGTSEHRHRGGDGPRGERPGLETIMTVLDVTVAELRAARDADMTLAELAEQQGVEVEVLIDALVAEAEEHIEDRVADGTLTQEQADRRLEHVEQRIIDRVNGVKPDRRGSDLPGRQKTR